MRLLEQNRFIKFSEGVNAATANAYLNSLRTDLVLVGGSTVVFFGLVGVIIIISILVLASWRNLLKARRGLENALLNAKKAQEEMAALEERIAAEKRTSDTLANARVREIDVRSRLWIYGHMLDHIQRWRKGLEDASVIGKMVRDNSDRLSRRIRDYWERIEEGGASSGDIVDSLSEYLSRRIQAYSKEIDQVSSAPATDDEDM